METIIESLVNYLRDNMPDIFGYPYIFAGYPQMKTYQIGVYVVLNSEERIRFLSFSWYKCRINFYIIVDRDYTYNNRKGQELIAYLNDLLNSILQNNDSFHEVKQIESILLGYDDKTNTEGIRIVYEVVSENA